MDVYKQLHAAGMSLPTVPSVRTVNISLAKKFMDDKIVYISGCGSVTEVEGYFGKLGAELDVERGGKAATMAAMNVLSSLENMIGDLNKVKSVVKLLVFVSSTPDFYEQPKVANSASQVFIDAFGKEAGTAARSAVGVSVLPGNIAVEVEALIELKS